MFILPLILILSITNCFGQENLNKNDLNVQPIGSLIKKRASDKFEICLETIDMAKQDQQNQHSLPLVYCLFNFSIN